MARPTKLTPELIKQLCQVLELGTTYQCACDYVGISFESFNQWRKKGEKAQSGLFLEFLESVKKAEAKCAVASLAKIQKAATEGSWQASAWLLERRYPNEYGRQRIDIGNPPNEQLIIRVIHDND